MTPTRQMTFALIAGLAAPCTISAQGSGPQRPIELGIDAAVARESGDQVTATTFTIPVSRFRVGFFLSDAISLEPSIALSYARSTFENPVTGDEISGSGTRYEFDAGLLFHFQPDRTRAQPYIRPFIGLRGFSNDSDNSDFESSGNTTALGVGLGFKIPATGRLGTRIEVGFSHQNENEPEFESTNTIFLALGLSFFTR